MYSAVRCAVTVMAMAKLVFVSELTSLQEKPPDPRVDSPLRKQFIIPSIRRIPVKTYKIGTVAKETRLSVKAIRFYEKIGLIPAPEKALSSGYRLYTETDLRRREKSCVPLLVVSLIRTANILLVSAHISYLFLKIHA